MNEYDPNATPKNDDLLDEALYKTKYATTQTRGVGRKLQTATWMSYAHRFNDIDVALLESIFSSTSPIAYEDRLEEADDLGSTDFERNLLGVRAGLLEARTNIDDAVRLVRETEHRARYFESVLRVEDTPEEWREHAEFASRIAEEASDNERQRWLDIADWAEQQAVSRPNTDRVPDAPDQGGTEQD